jgi:glutaredoxin 3
MASPDIVIYTKSWCPYCARAKSLLRNKGASFQEIDIEAQPERREEMIARSGRKTVPQIFIGPRHVGGCDDLHALEDAGELDTLLGAA